MPTNWPPSKQLALLTFANDFLAKIQANAALYGLLPLDATNLAPLVATRNTTMAAATDPATKTKVTTMAMQVAKVQVVAAIRALARRVQSNNTVTAAAKTSLGLPVHSAVPSPIAAPATRPMVNVVGMALAQMTIRIVDENTPSKRAKPAGATSAQVFCFIGPAGTPPPADLRQWVSEGLATRSDFKINYAPADNGKEATIVARWLNGKGEAGPASIPTVVPIAA